MAAIAPSQGEAKRICMERLAEMRELGYTALTRYCNHKLACEVLGDDGVKYAHETYALYDGAGEGGDIRLLVEVWAYGGRAWTKKLAGAGLLMTAAGVSREWSD